MTCKHFQFISLKFMVLYDLLAMHLDHWWVAEKLSHILETLTCVLSGRSHVDITASSLR